MSPAKNHKPGSTCQSSSGARQTRFCLSPSHEFVIYRKTLLIAGLMLAISPLIPGPRLVHELAVLWSAIFTAATLLFVLGPGMLVDSSIRHLAEERNKLAGELSGLVDGREKAVKLLSAPSVYDQEILALKVKLDEYNQRRLLLQADEEQMRLDAETRKTLLIARADERLRRLKTMQENDLRRAEAQHTGRIEELQVELDQLEKEESDEMIEELKIIQAKAIDKFLAGYSVEKCSIIGVPPSIGRELAGKGITSALSISEFALKQAGLPSSTTRSLLAWKTYLEFQANLSSPSMHNKTFRKKIRSKYSRPRLQVEAQICEAQSAFYREALELKDFYAIALDRLAIIEQEFQQAEPVLSDKGIELLDQLAAIEASCISLNKHIEALGMERKDRLNTTAAEIAQLERRAEQIRTQLAGIVLPSRLTYLTLVLGINQLLSDN